MTTLPSSSIQEEAPKINASINFNSDGNKLIFATADDFDRFIAADVAEPDEAFEVKDRNSSKTTGRDIKAELSSENYVSYAEHIAQNNLNNLIEDELLSVILNKDQIVQIGNFLYKLNKADEKVFVLPIRLSSKYADLVSENTKNPNIQVYSTAESVIDMVENGELSQKGIFCSAPSATHKGVSTPFVTINNSASMNATSQYAKYGIMHKLEADLHVFDYNSYSNLSIYVSYENCSYKKRCGSSLSNYSNTWRSPQYAFPKTSVLTQYRVRLYSSVHKLEKYTHKIRGRVNDYNNPVTPNPYKVTVTNWATIIE
jgi:hypothetical protein